jgi:UDP-N-acetylglucosamine--N-acetylmuramyl-(pentapeptide) pyrophosphoryl-undecaprenol N-acetylglucosamine transferase
VVFSKGGYDSVPTCLAAYLLRIPIIMHDSDSIPGRASLLISKLAHRVAVSYPQSIQSYSNTDIVAWIGQPMLEKYTPREDFKKDLDNERKNILITGGSQGSQKLNEVTLSILPQLISKYNIIHQTGGASIEDVKLRASVILENYNNSNYAPYANLDFSKAYPHLDLVIARAGSSIFEFIAWQIPSILVPIPENISRDQRSNALHASNMGYAKVIYEDNLSGSLLLNSIENILENKNIYETMRESCKKNYKKNASENIAKEIINICQSHS